MTKHSINKSELLKLAEERMYDSIYIHNGVERELVTSDWKKYGKDRTYIDIKCFSLAGNPKGTYRCGYYDNATEEYVVNRGNYDIVEDDMN